MTNLKLAEEVNLSPTPCLKRVRALEEKGVIDHYCAVLNPEKAGYGVNAMILMKISANTREAAMEFADAIAKISAVTECHTVAGRYDYICRVYARDMREHERVVQDELSRLPGLSSMETLFVLSTAVEFRGFSF